MYEAVYVRGIEDFRDTTARVKGKLVHFALASAIKNNYDSDQLLNSLELILQNVVKDFPMNSWREDDVMSESVEILAVGFDILKDVIKPYVNTHIVKPEYHIKVKLDKLGIELESTLDYLLESKEHPSKDRIIEGRANKGGLKEISREQLHFYHFLRKLETGFSPEGAHLICYFTGEVEEKVITNQDHNFINKILINLINCTEFKPLDEKQNYCYFCPINRNCITYLKRGSKRSQKEWEILGGRVKDSTFVEVNFE